MTTPVNQIKELLLIDLEKIYATFKARGYKKHPTDAFNNYADALLQKRHYIDNRNFIFFNIYAYRPIEGRQSEPSFEVVLYFESEHDYSTKLMLYSFTAERLIKELDQIEEQLISVYLLLKGKSRD